MNTRESYRTSVLPDLSGRGATAARTLVVAGPVALLGAQLAANLQPVTSAESLLSRVAVPLMLAWAAVLFLITRISAPVAAWTGLVAVTLQLTLVQDVSRGWLTLVVEGVGFGAFAVALWSLWWVPKAVPLLLMAFPVVDVLTPGHSNLLELSVFALLVAVSLVLAVRMTSVGRPEPAAIVAAPFLCSPNRACAPGRTCCARVESSVPPRIFRPLA
jgi:hypothetical protein